MPVLSTKKITRSGYRPETQIAQWMDLIPNVPMDNHGKVFVMYRGLDSFAHLIEKGVTHFTNYDMADGTTSEINQYQVVEDRVYDQVPQTFTQFGLFNPGNSVVYQWPSDKTNVYPWNWNKLMFQTPDDAQAPMTPEQGTAAGNAYPVDKSIIIFENTENIHAVGPQWPFCRAYCEALIPRMIAYHGAKGKQWYVAWNYFTNAGKTLDFFGSAAAAKAYATKPISEWDFSEILPGGTLELTNTCCFGIYLGALDLNARVAYNLVYNAFLHRKANKKLLVFMQGVLEWRPNNLEEIRSDNGDKLYKQGKLPHTPTQAFNYGFLSHVHADGFVPFSMDTKTVKPFQFLYSYHNTGAIYIPNGSSVPVDKNTYPHWINDGDGQKERFATNGSADNVAFGKAVYDETFSQTFGGVEKYARFKIDGGSYIEPSNVDANDISDANYARRGYVFTQKLGNKLAFYYLNSFADIGLHTVVFQVESLPGIDLTLNVHSSGAHAGIIDVTTIPMS